jgi:hypothetical protein
MKYLIAALLVLAACSKPKTIVTMTGDFNNPSTGRLYLENRPLPLTDAQKIDLLRKKARELHLQWHVFCTGAEDIDPNAAFQGTAWGRRVEDSDLTDRWMETGKTQADAAYALFMSIQGKPTHPAIKLHKSKEKEMCTVPMIEGN